VTLLLDTHAFLWWLGDDPQLGATARSAVADPETLVLVSAASAWEIAVKRALGKLRAPGSISDWIVTAGFLELAISVAHAVRSAELEPLHRDPFDRLLVAQAELEGLTLVTSDERLAAYGVPTLAA
jgi:PIN domain nuclease of toxin-antitoxin system